MPGDKAFLPQRQAWEAKFQGHRQTLPASLQSLCTASVSEVEAHAASKTGLLSCLLLQRGELAYKTGLGHLKMGTSQNMNTAAVVTGGISQVFSTSTSKQRRYCR